MRAFVPKQPNIVRRQIHFAAHPAFRWEQSHDVTIILGRSADRRREHELQQRITLDLLKALKQRGQKFAMLTAYDFPTAGLAERAGVHALLVGDSLANVILGHSTTRLVTLDLMIPLAQAVRRGAPHVFLIGDIPYESKCGGASGLLTAARRFVQDAGCDAVKFEAASDEGHLVEQLAREGFRTIAHLGLRPQMVLSPDGYRAQARDAKSIALLVDDARRMVAAGAAMILLEAVPAEAARAVVAGVEVPVVGCGAGPACDGHVVVTHDMLGLGAAQPPRFVPRLADVGLEIEQAMRRYVTDIEQCRYPAAQHQYSMRSQNPAGSADR